MSTRKMTHFGSKPNINATSIKLIVNIDKNKNQTKLKKYVKYKYVSLRAEYRQKRKAKHSSDQQDLGR